MQTEPRSGLSAETDALVSPTLARERHGAPPQRFVDASGTPGPLHPQTSSQRSTASISCDADAARAMDEVKERSPRQPRTTSEGASENLWTFNDDAQYSHS